MRFGSVQDGMAWPPASLAPREESCTEEANEIKWHPLSGYLCLPPQCSLTSPVASWVSWAYLHVEVLIPVLALSMGGEGRWMGASALRQRERTGGQTKQIQRRGPAPECRRPWALPPCSGREGPGEERLTTLSALAALWGAQCLLGRRGGWPDPMVPLQPGWKERLPRGAGGQHIVSRQRSEASPRAPASVLPSGGREARGAR